MTEKQREPEISASLAAEVESVALPFEKSDFAKTAGKLRIRAHDATSASRRLENAVAGARAESAKNGGLIGLIKEMPGINNKTSSDQGGSVTDRVRPERSPVVCR